MNEPVLSVIVPTCGRADALRRLLAALALQESPAPFEVIVVVDGADAKAIDLDSRSSRPFELRVVEQRRSGAAAARNRGVLEARAPLLLFLDDDVEPLAGTIGAHIEFHRRWSSVIGAGALLPRATAAGFIASALCGWWETMNEALADSRHRFSFRDLLTGHCSMSRATFDHVGPFDAALRCQEDFEFGHRAIEAGIDIRLVTGARAVHHDQSTLDTILRRKFDEGIASIQLTAKHPALLHALPLGRPLVPGRLARVVQGKAIAGGLRGAATSYTLRCGMRLFETLSMRDKWRTALERLMDYWYWRGVATAAGGAQAIADLRSRRALERPLVTIDLQNGLECAEADLDRLRPHRLRIVWGDTTIGELPDIPGEESLRGDHLRPLLLKLFPQGTATAAMRAGVLPEALRNRVAAGETESNARSCTGTNRAA